MKISRRITSFLLSAIMVVTTFLAVGPVFSVETQAAETTIYGIIQPNISEADWAQYESYRNSFFGGKDSNMPTELALPGIDNYYIPHSVAYWEQRDWILISSSDNSNQSGHHIYAIDAKTAKFVALFIIYANNQNNFLSYDFGIAVSKHNLYLIDSNSATLGYFPLSEMDIELNSDDTYYNFKRIYITDSASFGSEFNNARLAYCSVDDDILWMGNCKSILLTANAYDNTYPSALMGYQLKGADSKTEWNNLKGTTSTTDCAGNPTHCILFDSNLTNIQHASVNNGQVYLLRSSSQFNESNPIRAINIADIDITKPGSTQLQINGRTKNCHIIGSSNLKKSYSGEQTLENGESFCIIDDYVYMFGTCSATSGYYPVKVLWRVDRYALNGTANPDISDGKNLRTDYDVKLNANGLYDITIGSYATTPMQYYKQITNTTKPTDFVFVMDASRSMSNSFTWFKKTETNEFEFEWLLEDSDKNIYQNECLFECSAGNDEYFKDETDGTYHPLRFAIRKIDNSNRFMFWLYYVKNNQYYVINGNSTIKSPWTWDVFSYNVQNAVEDKNNVEGRKYTDCANVSSWSNLSFSNVPHYVVAASPTGDDGRLGAARDFIKHMILSLSGDNGTDHRVAFCEFTGTPGVPENQAKPETTGEYTGFFTYDSIDRTNIPHGYVNHDNYSKAFHSINNPTQLSNIKSILNRFNYTGSGDGYGNGGSSDLTYGMHMAKKILQATGEDYTAYGNRRACVIVLTDGGITHNDSDKTFYSKETTSIVSSSLSISSDIKNLGASVYTIRIGEEDISNFDENKFLEALSSNYIDGKSYDNYGTLSQAYNNNARYSYNMKLTMNDSNTTNFYYTSRFLNELIKPQSKHALAKFSDKVMLKETLDSQVFRYIDDVSSVSAGIATVFYDKLGRVISNNEYIETLSSPSVDSSSGVVTAKGFDYSKYYVNTTTAASGGSARKFVIKIQNVALNTSIANATDPSVYYLNKHVTGDIEFYRDDDAVNSGTIYKQSFPSDRIKIPQYTYVLDYGIRMDNPYINGKIKSIDSEIRYQQYPNPTFDNDKIRIVLSPDGTSNMDDLMYIITSKAKTAESAFVLVERPNGDFDWFRLNLVPASTVYFEESALTQGSDGDAKWTSSSVGTTLYKQDLSDANDIYGYDNEYASCTSDFSGGTYYTATLTSEKRRSTTLSTTFTGTGFELYGACGADTGIQVINVKKDGKTVKAAVVDTFYKDTQNYGTLYQTPVYNVSGLDYGTYTVEVTAAYLPSISGAVQQAHLDEIPSSVNPELADALLELGFDEILEADEVDVEWFDDNSVLNGGTGAIDTESFSTQSVTELVNYVDAIRIFEPALNGDDYYIESEKNARYYNIVDNLLTDNFFGENPGFVYVEGSNGIFKADTYRKNGANHELYLANTSKVEEALTFTVADYSAESRVMLSLRAAYGNPVVKIGGTEITVSSKTEMYYDITDYVKNGTVTIQNVSTDKSLLSIGYLKLTGESNLQTTSDLSSAIEMIETPLGGEGITSGSITNVEYTPSTDSHNSFNVTVNGRPTMIQFIEEDGGTRTYDRNNKNVVIKSYNADGAQVNSLDRTVAYEVWTIRTNLTGPDVRVRAKYLEDGAYKWDKDCYSFTYEILEPVLDADIRSITPAAVSGKKGSVEVKVVTGPDAEGIRFVMPDSTTCTYYAAKAVTLENGDLKFTGKAWMNEDGENLVKVYVRENGKWIEAGEISYTAE